MSQTEILPDDAALRLARRTRVLDAMGAAGVDILVVGREANARYVSGVRRLWTAGSRAFGPGCVLVRDGGAVHLLSTWDEGVPDDIPREHLYGISFNSGTFLEVLRNIDGAAEARTVATDALTPSGASMLAKAFPVAEIVDGEAMLGRARCVKMPDEIDAIRASVQLAERALATAAASLVAGATERQLTGVFMEAMANDGVTTPATQDIAWVTSREHPWQRSSRDTPVAPGDLVAFDAGVIRDGYFGELGRTLTVDDSATPDGRRLLARGDDLWDRLQTACRPGVPASALLDAYESAGVAPPPMPVARGLGLGFDLPLVSHALPATAAEQRLEPGMVFTLTAFVWQAGVGAAYGHDPVVITDTGAELLTTEPFRPATSDGATSDGATTDRAKISRAASGSTARGANAVTEFPPPEEIIRYEKDPSTKIATITFDRPDQLNIPTIAARRRYGDLIFKASIDDDVKVLVVRGVGTDLGTGADLDELMAKQAAGVALHEEYGIDEDEDITMPNQRSYRAGAGLVHWYANPRAGCRSLQEFKKISILEVKGYCYGWHFYQAADADLVVSSDDALFGHPAFRYVGYAPRMWQWALMMGMRKFQEMVFTGRPFTAAEMYECNFINSVVSRDELEAETAKYASACAQTRPTDTVFMQKVFFEVMKQHQGEYMGSMLSAWMESMGSLLREDGTGKRATITDKTMDAGLNVTVKDNDSRFPPEWRLSRSGRRKPPEAE